ncbi:MAG: hypothetical protein CM15mP65_02840 [Crocinitomicaceae bacterium]|nr:MAG: hypothetical protein CM15mP65_02840 [Crocinitomicaceae bacterium]
MDLPSQGFKLTMETSSGNIYRSSGYVGIGPFHSIISLRCFWRWSNMECRNWYSSYIPFNPYKLKVNGPKVNGDIDIIGYGN